MTSAVQNNNDLENKLPQVSGRYNFAAPIGIQSWFGCGGNADILFKPEDTQDLAIFLKNCPSEIDIHVMGVGSNIIIRDGGLRGAMVRLGRAFNSIELNQDTNLVEVGGAVLDANLARASAQFALDGLAFYAGIPGTIGGAVKMNAGAYGGETKDLLHSIEIVTRRGETKILAAQELSLSYRHSELPDGVIVTKAFFKAEKGRSKALLSRIEEIKKKRNETQPIKEKTGGSTFANPLLGQLEKASLNPDTKVWQLIDKVGGRGLMVGGAQMSEKHCNFMINTGDATSTDLEALGEEIKKRVYEKFGIELRWEIQRLGEKP